VAATSIKRFDVTGDPDEIALARDAIDRCTYDFGLLKDRVTIKFIPASQMEKVPGTNKPALAFCRSRIRRLEIRSGLRKGTARSVLLHEIGHMVDSDRLNKKRRTALMSLMNPGGEHWGSKPYRERPSECFAETFVRAFSDVPSALHDYYDRRIGKVKLDAYREIVLRGAPPDPDDEEPIDFDPEDEQTTLEEAVVRQPINVVTGQIGRIAKDTPFFHPDSVIQITSAGDGGDFDLVGETEDGQFRFAVVETRHVIPGRRVRALFLVEAARVSDVRLRPPPTATELADKLELAKQRAREIAEL
jgi:hypothetical protein